MTQRSHVRPESQVLSSVVTLSTAVVLAVGPASDLAEPLGDRSPFAPADIPLQQVPDFLCHPVGMLPDSGCLVLVVQTAAGVELLRDFERCCPASPRGVLGQAIASARDARGQVRLDLLLQSYRRQLQDLHQSWLRSPRATRPPEPLVVDKLVGLLRTHLQQMCVHTPYEGCLGDPMPLLEELSDHDRFAALHVVSAGLERSSGVGWVIDDLRPVARAIFEPRLRDEWGDRLSLAMV